MAFVSIIFTQIMPECTRGNDVFEVDFLLFIGNWKFQSEHTLNNMLDIYLATSNTTAKPFNEFINYRHHVDGIILYVEKQDFT
uniref:Uncharacterized protein n=1 Tax=Pararge aegeria TaxID=116150 RepID=S4PUQ2_9NEOP